MATSDPIDSLLALLLATQVAWREADESCIRVWRFHDAPKELQDLSRHGGDEDWLAIVPADFPDQWPLWMEEGTSFGCCTVSRQALLGVTVVIGAHA